MDAVLANIVAGRQAWLEKIQSLIEKNYFCTNLMKLLKTFDSSLQKSMRKAARPSGGMD
jgi:hypothetical protein